MNEPVAIVGMGCRLPGADGLAAFWDLLVEGRSAWAPLPESRLPRDLYFHPEKSRLGKSYSELGGVVSDRPADPTVCPITPAMHDRFDVAHTIFLEVASAACRDAGLDPFAMPRDRRTGVYVGHTGGSTRIGDIVYATGIDETARLLADVDDARSLLGSDVAEVVRELVDDIRRRYPGRSPGTKLDLGALAAAKIVRQALQLDGPFLVVDAACASSLQALAIACRAVLQGSIDQAIVGGASYCKSDSLVLFSAAHSVSNTGSFPFGRDADGLVAAEGYVAIVVKKLSKAIADGDRIRAVLRGLGVASDGKGKSLWAPREEGQVLAVERAYPDMSDIARIEYIEAHATSTQVGDATELSALARLMRRHLPSGHKIPIGSVKANIGHTLETAGLASLVKVVLAMEHGMIPPGTTARTLNDEFDWEGGPFSVPRQSLAWPAHADGSPRCAAVNAFGIGGLNVHVALAEHVRSPGAIPRPAARRADPDADAIAIVGAGCILPGAHSLAEFFRLLDRGETAIGPVPPDRWDAEQAVDRSGPRPWHTTSAIGGFVRDFVYDWRRHKVPPKQIAAANPLQFMLLEAADAALADAGGPGAGLDRTRTAVVVGTLFGGDFANELQMGLRLPETAVALRAALGRRRVPAAAIDSIIKAYEKKVLEELPALVDETGSFTSSTLASRLTKTFDLMGGALALDAGDCSSLAAIAAAADMLRLGTCDAVLCAAGERCMDLMAFEGRSLGGYLADEPVSVLNGQTTGGAVAGEGAVVLVLKRLSDARAAGNQIRGVIRGVRLGGARTRDEAVQRVVRDACAMAGLDPAAITALQVASAGGHDKSSGEIRVLGESYAAGKTPRNVVACAVDGLIGHGGAVAGAAGLVALAESLGRGAVPGTAALAPDSRLPAGVLASSQRQPIPAIDDTAFRAGCLTVVDNDQAGHLVIDNGKPVPAAARAITNGPAIAHETSAGILPRSRVAPVGNGTPRPLVAALFPGQGSQYTDMFRSLVDEVPAAADAMRKLDAAAGEAGRETLASIAWRANNGLGQRVWDTQWAMYLGDLFAWNVLGSFGFVPDVIASHSFGEFPALAAAGAWTVLDGSRAAWARAQAVSRHGPRDGAMLSVISDNGTVETTLRAFADQAWICAANGPEQFVVGGHSSVVDALEIAFEDRRIRTMRLAVPSPFHTPLLETAARELADGLRAIAVAPPTVPIYSSTTARPLVDRPSVVASLVRQMTETVRWTDVVNELYAAGVRTFVEVGPSGVLTGLCRRILHDRPDAAFLQFDPRGRAPAEHLARLRDRLESAGCLRSGPVQDAVVPASAPSGSAVGRVVSFDATARRRAKNRGAAAARSHQEPVQADHGPGNGTLSRFSPAFHENGENGHGPRMQRASETAESDAGPWRHAAEPQANRLLASNGSYSPSAVAVESTAAWHPHEPNTNGAATCVAEPTPAEASAAGDEVEAFLIDFVVEQTGYPREIVELDADLEADLGIDSIRKAQLFGEIGQRYGLSPEEGVSLDDFTSLRQVLAYMLPRVSDGGSRPSTNGRHASHKSSVAAPAREEVFASVAPVPAEGAVALQEIAACVASGPAAAQLESFLVDFVVEQTGYPREMVELGADLEADLGIDSIRKAQLFGEVGQAYGLSPEEGVSLDDFTTLQQVVDYLLPRVAGAAPGHSTAGIAADKKIPAETPPSSSPARSDDFLRGVERGHRHAAAIRLWARTVGATEARPRPPVLDAALAEEAEGIAQAAGVDAAVVKAALVSPVSALGGSDVVVVAPTGEGAGHPGILACFGRHAEPTVQVLHADRHGGCLVGVAGLPGAVLGWNDAGIAAMVVESATGDIPPGPVVERIVREARSLADARGLLTGLVRIPRGLVVVCAEGGLEVDSRGMVVPMETPMRRAEPRSPLVRVALADGAVAPEEALERLFRDDALSCAAGLSVACRWLAVSGEGGDAAVISGGPLGRNWLASAAGLGASWKVRGPAPAPTGTPVTRRYELTRQVLGSVKPVRSLAGQRVAILGAGPMIEPLVSELMRQAAIPLVLDGAANDDPDAAAEAIAEAEAAGAVRHLVVIGPHARHADRIHEGSTDAVMRAFAACQRWVGLRSRAGDLASATLTALTDLGGDFGLSGTIGDARGGGLTGLFKGIGREFPELHVRVVDAAATMPLATTARAFAAELTDGPGVVEVGLHEGSRVTVAATERAVTSVGPLPAALARGSCWIVTGGARGVTAACGLELGRRHGLRLVLVGSTTPAQIDPAWLTASEADLRDAKGRIMLEAKRRGDDPREAWSRIEKSIEIKRSLAAAAAAGVQARYEACNLADASAVEALVRKVGREVGPIRGIMHGAGWESACRFEKKTLGNLARTLAPKCHGLENLLASVPSDSLEILVGFGSTSGRFGGHGQADYSLANDMLAKRIVAERAQRAGLRAATFHWHAWDEVGMASRPESRFVLEQFGLAFMPLAEGVRRCIEEIEAGLPVAEVLVTEPAMLAHVSPAPTDDDVGSAAGASGSSPPSAGSLVAGIDRRANDTWVSFLLDPVSDRFLIDHLQHGRPLLPAVMGAELLAQAALAAGACERVAELRDFVVDWPLGFPSDAPREVRVEVKAAGVGRSEARGWSALPGPEGRGSERERVHFRAVVTDSSSNTQPFEVGEPPFPFNPMVYQETAPLRHGPSFRTLDGLFLDRSGGWGRLTAPRSPGVSAPRGDRGWSVPVALLDGVIVGCAVYSYILCGRRVEIPVGFERLHLMAAPRPGEKCTSRMVFKGQDARETLYDVVVAGEDGRPLVVLDGLRLAVMAGERSPPA